MGLETPGLDEASDPVPYEEASSFQSTYWNETFQPQFTLKPMGIGCHHHLLAALPKRLQPLRETLTPPAVTPVGRFVDSIISALVALRGTLLCSPF